MDVTMARSGRREHGLILVLNCGSSSIKFAVFDSSAAPLPASGIVEWQGEGIGGANPDFERPELRRSRSNWTRHIRIAPHCASSAIVSVSGSTAAGSVRSPIVSSTAAANTSCPCAWTRMSWPTQGLHSSGPCTSHSRSKP